MTNGALVAIVAVLGVSVRWPSVTPYWMVLAFPPLVYGLACEQGLVARLLATRSAQFWGRASYSVYMVHGLVIMALAKVIQANGGTPSVAGMAVRIGMYLLAIALIAAATYRFLEEPGRRWMRSLQKRRSRTAAQPDDVLVPSARTDGWLATYVGSGTNQRNSPVAR